VSTQPLSGIRVLAVDDHVETNELVRDILRAAGASVVSVDSADAAFRALQSFRPNVLVCDLGMPEEDGCSLIQRIRALSRGARGDIPALALTGYTRNEDRLTALVSGFTAYLTKPVQRDQLVAALNALVPRPGL
jgi:CheY-like chemotaxis protein